MSLPVFVFFFFTHSAAFRSVDQPHLSHVSADWHSRVQTPKRQLNQLRPLYVNQTGQECEVATMSKVKGHSASLSPWSKSQHWTFSDVFFFQSLYFIQVCCRDTYVCIFLYKYIYTQIYIYIHISSRFRWLKPWTKRANISGQLWTTLSTWPWTEIHKQIFNVLL